MYVTMDEQTVTRRRATNKKILISLGVLLAVVIASAIIGSLASSGDDPEPAAHEPGVVYPVVGDPGCPKEGAVGCGPYRQADMDKCTADGPVGPDGLFKTRKELEDWCRTTAKSMYGLSKVAGDK
jgi:hypothetical protein